MTAHSTPLAAGCDDPAEGLLVDTVERLARRFVRGSAGLSGDDRMVLERVGSAAAKDGLTAADVVGLCLRATARAWDGAVVSDRASPRAGEQLLRAVGAVAPALVDGHQNVGRHVVEHERILRQELIDDLVRGDADVASLVQRSEAFGLNLGSRHQIVLAEPRDSATVSGFDETVLSRAVMDHYGDRDTLVSRRSGRLLALLPARHEDVDDAGRWLHAVLRRAAPGRRWRVAAGRPFDGAHGIARSYQEGREAIDLLRLLHADADLVAMKNLLIYRVLGRDRQALRDLVDSVLVPPEAARGGAEPLIATLEAYFATGAVVTQTARRLHVSARTVSYRLTRVTTLTGYRVSSPMESLTLQVAVLGARMLNWPACVR